MSDSAFRRRYGRSSAGRRRDLLEAIDAEAAVPPPRGGGAASGQSVGKRRATRLLELSREPPIQRDAHIRNDNWDARRFDGQLRRWTDPSACATMEAVANRGGIRERLRAYNEYWARPPSRWQQVAAVFLTPFPSLLLWDKRGAAVAILALLVYGSILIIGAFKYHQVLAWQRQHATVHSLLIVPLIFLLLAAVTNLALALCIAIAVAFGAVFVPSTALLRRRLGTLSAEPAS